MITREQLELAAKAAGIEVVRVDNKNCSWYFIPSAKPPHNRRAEDEHAGELWNPQEDDAHGHGQLLDLAMACDICIDPNINQIRFPWKRMMRTVGVNCQDFPALAEAVILAAAEQQQAKETKE